MTTYAGTGTAGWVDGPRETARFEDVLGLAWGNQGDLIVVEGHHLRRIDAAGNVTTIAGKGSSIADGTGGRDGTASFGFATHAAVDRAGNIYVSDQGVLRKVDPAGNVITIAGNGATGDYSGATLTPVFRDPAGIAINKAGDVFIASRYRNRICRIPHGGGRER